MNGEGLIRMSDHYTIMIVDKVSPNKYEELFAVHKFIRPDKLITDVPIKGLPSFNFTSKMQVLGSISFHTDKTMLTNSSNNIIITDKPIDENSMWDPLLLCMMGLKFKDFVIHNRRWFGTYNDIPWVACDQQGEHLWYIILQINKQSLTIDDGSHSFEWSFWNEQTLRDSPNTIFTNEDRL